MGITPNPALLEDLRSGKVRFVGQKKWRLEHGQSPQGVTLEHLQTYPLVSSHTVEMDYVPFVMWQKQS